MYIIYNECTPRRERCAQTHKFRRRREEEKKRRREEKKKIALTRVI